MLVKWLAAPYGERMADGRSGKHTMFRIVVSMPETLWEQFGKLAGTRNRSGLLRQFVAWYLREPGARLPERPPRQP